MQVFATADNVQYECDLSAITFRPTMMFQTRSFPFTLKNPSTAKMRFQFSFEKPDDTLDASGLYTISPENGEIDGESAVEVLSVWTQMVLGWDQQINKSC